MKVRRLLAATLAMTLLGSSAAFSVALQLEPNNFAVFSKGSVSLAGSSVVTGHVATGNGVVNLTAQDATNIINGDIYTGSSPQITAKSDDQYGTVIQTSGLNFPTSIPSISGPPTIANQGGNKTFSQWSNPTPVTTDTHYTSITVNGLMVVDVQTGDRVIRAGSMTISGGRIILQGNGRLFLFVDSAPTFAGWALINQPDSAYGCPGNKDNLHLVVASGNMVLNNGTPINGSVYLKNGTLTLGSGGPVINGNIVASGQTASISHNAVVNGVVYAPNANVSMGSSGTINGYLVCNSLSALGSVRVNHISLGFSIPAYLQPSSTYVNGLVGEYYDTLNPTKESYKRMVRVDSAVEFNWQLGSPHSCIEPDTFSVRWTGFIEVPTSGTYTFSTYSDDGVRLWINNTQVIDRWGNISLEFTNSPPVALTAGIKYPLKMEYQENPINSTVFLFWRSETQQISIVPPSAFWITRANYDTYKNTAFVNPVRANGTGLRGEYFVGSEGLYGQAPPVAVVQGEMLYHNWGTGSPSSAIPPDGFSARWTGYIEAKYTEDYYLDVTADDGVKVWINDVLKLDAWRPNSNVTYSIPVSMVNGQFAKIKIDYYEHNQGAALILAWRSEGQEREVIPLRYLRSALP